MTGLKRFLAVWAIVCCSFSVLAQTPPAPAPATQPPFKFTKIENELLEKARQLDRYIEQKGMVLNDPAATEYVERVGKAVVPPGPPPENVEWRFRIARDPLPNAFALPNGSIYITTGLLARLENEAQLAGVLAHEAVHVTNRHSYNENRSYRKKMVAAHVFQAIAAVAGAAGGVAGVTVQAIASLIPSILVATVYGYSRELEREADVRAISTLNEAEYSAEEMPNSFRLLQKGHEVQFDEEPPTFYADHPKLSDRIRYTTELSNALRAKSPHPMVEPERYVAGVERGVRHDIGLEILSGRGRTAVALARDLVKRHPESSEDYWLLGEALRALGPRTPEPTPAELTSDGKKKARKLLSKSTLQEYEDALLVTPEGQQAWEENAKQAEEAYRKALELDPQNARAHRGLGFLYERRKLAPQALEEYRKYLELAPAATDRIQILRRIETLDKPAEETVPKPPAP